MRHDQRESDADMCRYYSGILFLTTNRVGIFDPAFKSRIHISLYYPPLNGVATIKIWKVNIDRTKSSERGYDIDEDAILEFAKGHFLSHDQSGRSVKPLSMSRCYR